MAGFSNLYPNLPGMLVEFKDGGKSLLKTNVTYEKTDSVLLLGTSLDGPVLEPIAVDISTVEAILGSDVMIKGVSNGSTLLPAFKQAWEGGCRDIRVMRVSGETAKSSILSSATHSTVSTAFAEPVGLTVDGNDATVLTLTHQDVVQSSAQLYYKDGTTYVNVPGGFTVGLSAGTVNIPADLINAGVELKVEYEYNETVVDTTQTSVVDEDNIIADDGSGGFQFTIPQDIVTTTVPLSIKYPDIVNGGFAVIDPSEYSVVKSTILGVPSTIVTITSYDISNNVLPTHLDTVQATYNYIGTTVNQIAATDTGTNTTPYVAKKSAQVITLTNAPNSTVATTTVPAKSSLVLAIAGITAPLTSYTVDPIAKTISIAKENFNVGDTIEINYYYDFNTTVVQSIYFESIFGGDVYNQASVEVKEVKDVNGDVIDTVVQIVKPDSKKAQIAEEPLTYSCVTFKYFQSLVTAINNDPRNNIIVASTDSPYAISETLNIKSATKFDGGNDGLNLTTEELFVALHGNDTTNGAYQLLENYSVDYVVPVGVYADDYVVPNKTKENGTPILRSFAYELALFCAILSYRNKTTLGIIAMKPVFNTSLAGINSYSQNLCEYNKSQDMFFMIDLKGNYIMDATGDKIDLGKFISIVGGPEPKLFDGVSLGTYYGNPAVSYAAMNTTLLASSAPTNKIIPGTKGLKFNFSNKQLDLITGNRIVTFKTKSGVNGQTTQAAYVVDSMTAVRADSDYTRITTMKVIREVVDQLREVADPYIGESVTVEQKNSLASAFSKRLGILKEKGFILDFAFSLVFKQLDTVVGEGSLELTIVPPQELRRITTMVALRSSL